MNSPLILRELSLADEQALKQARADFNDPHFIFALDFQSTHSYADYLDLLKNIKAGINLKAGYVPATLLFGFVGDVIVGRLSFRHTLNAHLLERGGHLGYGVVPKYRNQGHATNMLRQGLILAKNAGLKKVLVTCDDDNIPSRKTIEKCGGILEDIRHFENDNAKIRRYWVVF